MSESSTPHSYSDSSRQTMPPVKKAKVSNLETNPSTRGHPSQSTSSFGYEQEAFQTEQPSFQNDHFSFQNGQPPFQNYHPSFQNGQPSFPNDKPSFQNDDPSSCGDSAAKGITDDGKKDEDSDPWKIGANSNSDGTPDEKDNSLDEMELAVSESLGTWATEFRDEVMLLKPSFQYQEDQDETIVTRAELLLRDTVQYREKLAAIKVTFKVADDPSIVIKKDGKLLYDHLVIFSPTVEELGGSLSVEAIVEFINDGGNVMMAGSSRGGGVITDHESLRVLDVLTGCSFSYSHNPEDPPITEYPNATGKNAEHIAGLQDRNNARVIFAGSMDLFSDEMFSSLVEKAGSGAHGVPSGNAYRTKALSAWCFQMAGVVRIDSVEFFTAKKFFLIARVSSILGVAILSFLVDSIIRANHLSKHRSFFLLLILLISIPLFWNFFKDIPVPKLVLLGAILISSGLILLLPGPSSPPPILPGPSPSPPFLPFQQSFPTIIIIFMIVGASQGAFTIARAATRFVFVPWVLKSLGSFDSFLGIVFGMWLSAAITFDKAIFVLIGMEVVVMLLVLI